MATEDREAAFLDRYMIDFNASEAARAIGSSNPGAEGWKMLQRVHIRDEINRRLAERRAANKLTVSHIEGMLRDLAEVEPLDIWDHEGRIRPLQDMPPHARKAIKSIKRKSKENFITGDEEVTLEIELWDKKGAIELLGKYKKMFTDKVDLDVNLNGKVAFTINGVIK